MRNVRMTGRERVGRMFRREDQDCIPRSDSYWSETIERWRSEGMEGDPYDHLGLDFHGVCWSDPKPYPTQHVVVGEDDLTLTYLDAWGNTVRYWKNRSGTPEHVAFGCTSRETWERVTKPALLNAGPFVDPAGSLDACARGRRHGRWVHLTGLETFEMTRRVLGDETTLMGLAEDPDWIVDVSQTLTSLVLKDFDVMVGAGVEFDGVWIYGDMAYRSGTMCSPKMYRELIWPDHKRLADWAHAKGVPFIFHTDGDVNAVVPDYIDAGFDCLQPLEAKARMDVREMAPLYIDRLALFGNIDVMILGSNDLDAVEHEVVSKLGACMPSRGYAYHSDHSVPPQVSWDTYRFVIRLLDQYGNYD